MQPDWQAVEERLVAHSALVIERFGAAHPDVVCACFAIYAEPAYGAFSYWVETRDNALRTAQRLEREVHAARSKLLSKAWSWQHAHAVTTKPRVEDFVPDISAFAYPEVDTLAFPGWEDFLTSAAYPQGDRGPDPDAYLEGNVRIVLWKVLERLISKDSFRPLRLAAPFRVRYQFHDEALMVLRILNWPEP